MKDGISEALGLYLNMKDEDLNLMYGKMSIFYFIPQIYELLYNSPEFEQLKLQKIRGANLCIDLENLLFFPKLSSSLKNYLKYFSSLDVDNSNKNTKRSINSNS